MPRKPCPALSWLLLLLLAGVRAEASAPQFVLAHAMLITMADGERTPFEGYLAADRQGRIIQIGRGEVPAELHPDWTYDAGGKWVLPGFLSGHSHLTQSVLRGLAPGEELLGWIKAMGAHSRGGYVAGDLYAFALHGSIDYLRHGITTCYNYTGRGPTMSEERYDEQFFAELDSGQRFVFGLSLPGAQGPAAMRQAFAAFSTLVAPYRGDPHFLKLSLAKSGLMSHGGEASIDTEAAIALEHGLDIQMHYLEPRVDEEAQRAAFPKIVASGALKAGLMYAHFIHTDDEIVRVSGQAGARMIWNPMSNGRLASGLADIPKYQAAGIKVGMGIDGQASADVSDPFENMRMGLYQLRMAHESGQVMQPYDVLRLHTLGTAEALGVERDVGSLAVGKYADFVVIDPGLMDTGPIFDPYATLIFACSIANLDWVFVGGEAVAHRGELLKVNSSRLDQEVRERVAALEQRLKASTK
jgi:cytosine/adenosine deaminase-related metal-dependent hydrolase